MTNSPHAEATPADQRLTSIRRADYLGSHPSAPTPLDDVDIVFTTSGVRFERKREELGRLPWSDVVDLAVDGTVTFRRSSAVMGAVFGLIAALFSSRTDVAIARIQTTDGTWTFGVDDLSTDELRSGLSDLDPYRH